MINVLFIVFIPYANHAVISHHKTYLMKLKKRKYTYICMFTCKQKTNFCVFEIVIMFILFTSNYDYFSDVILL